MTADPFSVPCADCHQAVGEQCRNLSTGFFVKHFVAHYSRIRQAERAAEAAKEEQR